MNDDLEAGIPSPLSHSGDRQSPIGAFAQNKHELNLTTHTLTSVMRSGLYKSQGQYGGLIRLLLLDACVSFMNEKRLTKQCL